MNLFSLLLAVATNPKTLKSMAGMLLLVGTWFLCSALGIRGNLRLLIMVGVLLLVAGVQILLMVRSRRKQDKAAADLETSMIMEADQSIAAAGSGQKTAREDARRELVAAIDVLKRSQLADGRGGKAALYVLPWYLVLGAGYSGKSSVVRHSGLQPPDKGPGELRGIGASSNCEWWFTNHAVLLEADRRFAATAGTKAAERDWETFLTTLRKQRPRISLNGVVVTVSAADLMQGTAGEIEAQARLLRNRLDAVADELKLVFPIYLVVTKLDQVQGFEDFFAGLAGAGAEQIFGCTVRAAQMRSAHPDRVFAREFELLYQTLVRRRQLRLVQEEHRQRRDGTFLFPLQFRAMGDGLQRFVQLLCEPNAYGRNPLLRGFYFTSAGGDGETSDQVLHEMSRVLGLHAPAAEPVAPGLPLFLRSLFRKVLVPDRDIARPTRGAARRMRLIRRLVQVTALTALVALGATMTVSFVRNLGLVKRTRELAVEAAEFQPGAEGRLIESNDKLPLLDDLRRQLVSLDGSDDGHSPALGLGMYRGHRANTAARRIYLDRFVVMVARPYFDELANWLRRTRPDEDGFDEFYRRYQVYRMLHTPTQGDSTLMVPVLQDVMRENREDRIVGDRDLERLAEHVQFALRHAPEMEGLFRSRANLDPNIQRTAGGYIADHWQIDAYYRKVVARINQSRPDLAFDLQDLGGGGGVLIHADDAVGGVLRVIPASFTRQGWDEEASRILGNTEDLLRDSWLLPDDVKRDLPRRQGQLLNLYAEDYASHWRRFLMSVSLEPPHNLDVAKNQLRTLQQEGSRYRRLIDAAIRNLDFDLEEKDYNAEVVDAMNGIKRDFGALHAFLKTGKEDEKPSDRFLGTVQAVESSLDDMSRGEHRQAAANFTREVFEARSDRASGVIYESLGAAGQICEGVGVPGDPDCNRAFKAYLNLPALSAWYACLRETEQYLQNLWAREVSEPFAPLLGRYPLAANGEDAGIDEFGRFFHGGGTLQTFVKERLQPYLEDPGFIPRRVHDQGLRLSDTARGALNKGERLREVLFGDDRATPRIEFKVRGDQARVVGQKGLHVAKTVFAVGRNRLEYGQGTASYETFVWPPSDDPNRAWISASLIGDDTTQRQDGGDSAWALFRLVAAAEESPKATPTFGLTWKINLRGRAGSIAVPFDFDMNRSEHAFRRGLLAFSCPKSLFE